MPVTSQPPSTRVILFGSLRLEIAGRKIAIPEGKPQNLLAYLLLNPEASHQREVLAECLWPNVDPVRQRRSLSTTLYRLQQIIGKGWVEANPDTIALVDQPGLWVDAWEFAPLAQRGDFESCQAAIQLYQGELLPGIFDDWLLSRRESLHQQYLACLLKMGEFHEANGQMDTSLTYYQTLSAHDPLREEAGRGMMRCLARLGRFSEALNTFENLQNTLAQNLGVEPGIETRLLADQLRSEWELKQQAYARPLPPHFVGRLSERARLLSLLDQARQGQGGLVVLIGEAGIGKTRLLDELAQSVGWRGWRVVWGRAEEYKIPAAYGPLDQALQQALPTVRLEQLAHHVAAASLAQVSVQLLNQPAPLPLPETSDLEQLSHALASVLDGLQHISPHLILLDDLQWADPTLWPLLDLLRPALERMAILLVLTMRSEEILLQPETKQTLENWDRQNQPILQLTGLDASALRQLAAPWRLMDDQIGRLAHASGGNPLFALELLQTENLETRLQEHPSLGELALQKLVSLSAEAQYALQIASVIGYRFSYRPWAAMLTAAKLSGEKIPSLAGELERAGLLHLEPDGYRFAHDTLRTAIYTHIPAPQCRQLHAQALTILEETAANSTLDLLYHARKAQNLERIASHALLAGEQALASFHYGAAVGFFTQALEALPPGDLRTRYQALSGRMSAYEVLANRSAQRDDLQAMQTLAAQLGERCQAEVYRDLAAYFWVTGDYSQALETGKRGLHIAEQLGEPEILAAMLEILGKASRDRGNYTQARAWLLQAQGIYQAMENRRGEAIIMDLLGIVSQREGHLAQAEELCLRAVDVYHEIGDIYKEARALSNLGVTRWESGALNSALESFEAALVINQQIGDRRAEIANLSNLASLGGIMGDLACSLGLLDEALALARQTGDRAVISNLLLNRGITLHALGHLSAAKESMDEALAVNRSLGRRRGEGYTQYNRGKLLTDLGDYDAALTAFEDSIQVRSELGEQKNLLSTQVALARLHVKRNAVEAAQGVLRQVWVGYDSQNDGLELQQEAHLAAFEVLQAAGDETQALEHLIDSEAAMLANAATLPEGDRQRFFEVIPLNRETRAALLAYSRVIEVSLARADAPRGKKLAGDDFVTVRWTVSTPGDQRIASESARRQQVLQRLAAEAAAQNAAPTDDDLAQALGVSRRTVLRDMQALVDSGVKIGTRQRTVR